MDNNVGAVFEPKPFAEGRFRYAHMGTWRNPLSRRGQKCVIKHMKSSYTWEPTGWDITVKMHEEAQTMAKKFNRFSQAKYPIQFTKVEVKKCIADIDDTAGPCVNEYCTVEDYIDGRFTKWTNNYGFSAKQSAASLSSFMHWSWVHTNGERMVADLQGTCTDDGYTLTDPAMMSLSREYGVTDTGVEGMALFFASHQCGSYCSMLPRPTKSNFSSVIPKAEYKACMQLLTTIQSATTYTHELRLSPQASKKLEAMFRSIAFLECCSCP